VRRRGRAYVCLQGGVAGPAPMGATLASHTGGPRRQRGRANELPLSRRNGGGPYNGTLSLCFTSVMEKNYRHYERELRSNDPHNMLQLQWPLLIRSIHSIFLGCVPEYFGIFYVVPYLERMRIRLWFFFGFSACSWKLQSRTERAQVPDGLRAAVGGPASCQCQPRVDGVKATRARGDPRA
jgi:hypothetical protein